MSDDALEIIVNRLLFDAQLIDRMLREDHRQRYFDALLHKKGGRSTTNVTAAFFADPGPGGLSAN